MGAKGINIRQVGDRILFRSVLLSSAGDKITSGSALLYLYEIQNDASLKAYDWADHTFKTTALGTETQALTHRTTNNSTRNTGLWSYALTTVTGFTPGNIYVAEVTHPDLSIPQYREFQYGADESDLPMVYGRVDTGTFTATAAEFETNLTVAIDGHFNKAFLMFITGSLAGQVGKVITTYEGTTTNVNDKGKITLAEGFTGAPANLDQFIIVGASA